MIKFHPWSAHAFRVAVAAALSTAIQHIHTIAVPVLALAHDFFREVLVTGAVDVFKEATHLWSSLFSQ